MRGFDVPATLSDLAAKSKLGLMGMQERARILGGRLLIDSAPNSGTTVIADLPTNNKSS